MNCKSTCPAVRVVMFPKDTDPAGTITGGNILCLIDVAGAVAAAKISPHRLVTVSMDKIIFKKPVLVGDIITCWSEVVGTGRTSIDVKILVEAERHGKIITVTEALAKFVAVDKNQRPIPWDSPVGTMAPETSKALVAPLALTKVKSYQEQCNSNCPAVRLVMFPKDCNPSGNIFGGIILSHIDVAGAVAAGQLTTHRVVTVSMDKVVFKKPVLVGDILTCWTEIVNKGHTSIEVKIFVEAERRGEIIKVTEGQATYVAVDKKHRPVAWDSPAGTRGDKKGKKTKKSKHKGEKKNKKNKKNKN